jgi:transaldolase
MKFFIDTADVSEIADLASSGLVDGVTTNPSLIAKSGRNFLEVVRENCEIVPDPVSAEVTVVHLDGMLAEERKLARLAARVVTLPPKVLRDLALHQLPDKGLTGIPKDWEATGQRIL